MQWYENTVVANGIPVLVKGIFRESDHMLLITVEYDFDTETHHLCPWSKTVNLWAHQEILAEDIYSKYLGKIKKIEQNLPTLIGKTIARQDVFKMIDQESED